MTKVGDVKISGEKCIWDIRPKEEVKKKKKNLVNGMNVCYYLYMPVSLCTYKC